MKLANRTTLDVRNIEACINDLFVGDLALYAVSFATKKLHRFITDYNPGEEKSLKQVANLVFLPSRVEKLIKYNVPHWCRIQKNAIIYLTAVLEFLTAELIELSSQNCMDSNKKTIAPYHLSIAINNDSELKQLARKIKFHVVGGKNKFGRHFSKDKKKKIVLKEKKLVNIDAITKPALKRISQKANIKTMG
jgi:histone H3/H4